MGRLRPHVPQGTEEPTELGCTLGPQCLSLSLAADAVLRECFLEEQVQQGLWWLPAQPEHQLPGVLTCEPDDWVKLSLVGGFGDNPNHFHADMVAGLIQGAWVTLLGCTQARFQFSSPGFESQQLFAQAILRGAAFETPDEVRFDRAVVEFSHLGEWAALTGMTETMESEEGRPVSLTVSYRPPEGHTAEIPGGKVTLGFNWTASGNPLRQRQIEQRTALTISLDESLPLYPFIDRYVQPLRNLLTLATGVPCTVTQLVVSRRDLTDGVRPVPIRVELPKVFPAPGGRRANDILFTLNEFDFSTGIPCWLDMADRLEDPCDLLIALRYAPPMHAEYRLLIAVAAAEALHRRLFPRKRPYTKTAYREIRRSILAAVPAALRPFVKDLLQWANQLKLNARLAELIELAGPSIAGMAPDTGRWSKQVARVRNQLTHWDPEQPAHKLNASQLFWLAEAVGTLVTVCLLRELGFTEDERTKLLANNQGYQHLLGQLRQDLGERLGYPENYGRRIRPLAALSAWWMRSSSLGDGGKQRSCVVAEHRHPW
jgi:hypothetical protein